jgi:hypothetical protein
MVAGLLDAHPPLDTMKSSPLRRVRQFGMLLVCLTGPLSGCASSPSAVTCKIVDPELSVGIYYGICKNGWADGYGRVIGATGYEGDFLAGKKHGLGTKLMSNGDRYTGEFRDDYRHGKGTYVWGENSRWAGDQYSGEYQRDLRHGWGVFQWDNGDRYEGQWVNDLRLGASVMEQRRAARRIENQHVAP